MIFFFIFFCCIAGPVLSESNNNRKYNKRYLLNDGVVEHFVTFYDSFAQTTSDANDIHKRCFSIMLSGVLQLMAQNGEGSFDVSLCQPADVIAAPYRGFYGKFKVTLYPAIKLVQSLCSSSTTSKDCENRISEGVATLSQECDGFNDHWKFYELTAKIIDDDDFIGFREKILNATLYCANDDNALEFLNQWQNGTEFDAVRPKMINWYKTYTTGNYSCNLPPLSGYCSS